MRLGVVLSAPVCCKPLLALHFTILGFDPEHVEHKWVTVEEAGGENAGENQGPEVCVCGGGAASLN